MAICTGSTAMSRRSTVAGSARVPGLVDCHTHACFAGDRVHEFSLRAGGASYEELHAAGGGILSTVRATRAAGTEELVAITARHRDRMRAHGTTTFEGKSGYGLDRDTELAQLRAVRAAGGVPTWLGAHTVPPEFADGDPTSTSCSRTCFPTRHRSPRLQTCFSSVAPSMLRRLAAI